VVTTTPSVARGSRGPYPWRLDVCSLCRPSSQTLVGLRDFQHFASRDGIKYFRGYSARILSAIVPMRRIVKQLLAHGRASSRSAPQSR
jgi:hypothetical protein